MSLGKTKHALSPKWPALEVSCINSSFLGKFRFPVREYTRGCNTDENIHIH